MRPFIFIVTLASALFVAGQPAFGAVPSGAPESEAIKAVEGAPPVKAEPARKTCHLTGTVLCSEYGTRFKEDAQLVFITGGERFAAKVDQDTGAFNVELPCGVACEMRLEYADNGFSMGKLELSGGPEEHYMLEIYYPGSMLELVMEARRGKGGGTDFKLIKCK